MKTGDTRKTIFDPIIFRPHEIIPYTDDVSIYLGLLHCFQIFVRNLAVRFTVRKEEALIAWETELSLTPTTL